MHDIKLILVLMCQNNSANNGGTMTVARLNVDLNFLREQHFAHKYFEFTDANNIKVLYANEDICCVGDSKIDLHANTVTVFVPDNHDGYDKFEFPDLRLVYLDIDCSVPKSTRGTLICDADIGFESQSLLLNGDILGVINESLILPFNQIDTLTLFADPSSGKLELFF